MIEPRDILFQNSGGTVNMGSLTLGSDSNANDAARFSLPGRFALKFVRVHFRGSGAGTADMAINLDSHLGPDFDCLLHTVKAVGKGADAWFRVPQEEVCDFTFQPGDELVLTWTNPDSGNIIWGAEVGLTNA